MNTRNTLYAAVEWKAGAGTGEVEGYASVFGNVDRVGDVVMPGAFRKTVSDWKRATQPLPLTADHNITTDGLIGSIVDLAERAKGLWFKARFSRSEKAQRVRADILDGHLRGTSFIYEAIRHQPGRIEGKAVRFLEELRLHEITIAPGPMIVNELAGVTAAKAELIEVYASDLEDWFESMRHALDIRQPTARKAAALSLIAEIPQAPTDSTSAAGQDAPGTEPTEPGAAPTDTASAESTPAPSDAYAVSFLSGPPDGAPTGEPPAALPGPLADLDHKRSIAEIDALEADIRTALEG